MTFREIRRVQETYAEVDIYAWPTDWCTWWDTDGVFEEGTNIVTTVGVCGPAMRILFGQKPNTELVA